MALIVEVIYEDGVLKPTQPLPLQEHTKYRIRIANVAAETAGMVPWNGDEETLRRLASDPEFGIMESP